MVAKDYKRQKYFRKIHPAQNSLKVIVKNTSHVLTKLEETDLKTCFPFQGKLNDKVSDKALTSWADSIDEFSDLTPPFRLIKTLNAIGAEHFVNKAQADVNVVKELLFLRWKSTMKLNTFVSKFNSTSFLCLDHGFFTLPAQTMNQTIKTLNDVSDEVRLLTFMQTFGREVVQLHPDGLNACDDTPFIAKTEHPNSSLTSPYTSSARSREQRRIGKVLILVVPILISHQHFALVFPTYNTHGNLEKFCREKLEQLAISPTLHNATDVSSPTI